MTYPHHQIPINTAEGRKPTSDPCHSVGPVEGRKHTSDPRLSIGPVEGRKHTSDPRPSIGPGKGRKHTSNPRPCTTSDDEGMKPTSDPIPSNDIACRLRAKTNSWQATWQPACLPETIFVYARNYSTQNRVQIPPTPTPPPQTPMF